MKQEPEVPGTLWVSPVHDRLKSVEIPESTLSAPRSMYRTYNPATEFYELSPSVSEVKALAALDRSGAKAEHDGEDDDDYHLDDFVVYSNHSRYAGDLTSLHELFRSGKNVLFFDGMLSKGQNRGKKYWLRRVAFGELSVGNYGVEHHTVGDSIWIRSVLNRKKGDLGAWYKLGAPGIEYIRFFEPFRWLADLAKHLVDYIEARKRHANVGIHNFRNHFATWLLRTHGNACEFQSWFRKHPSYDYRSDISAYAEFLQHQVHGTLPDDGHDIKLFKEVLHLTQYPAHSRPENDTIVTPYVFSLFSHMECRAFLKATVPKNAPAPAIRPRRNSRRGPYSEAPTEALLASIKPGDVISTTPDDSKSGTKWLHSHARWYARVQKISLTKRGERLFHVAWLYHPSDTPCGKQLYPWDNELFFSNHCSCHSSVDHAILTEEVLGKHSVEWFGNENTKAEFFVRQIYLTEERRWVALRESDLVCGQVQDRERYRAGDTILAQMVLNAMILEPCEIIDFSGNKARLRQLKRRHTMINGSSDDAPNELVYTDDVISIPISWVQGPCTVRIIPAGTTPPTPYDRRGTGNCFYITHRLQGDSTLVPITDTDTDIPSSFRQGFSPGDRSCTPLRGLDLFAGCGNLGRGFEESGAVKVKWVNDIWDAAIHTYMANADPKTVVPFLGSVDIMLEKALKGECGPSVPAKGEVEFISGGSPCQGFSLLTADKSSDSQKKNRSLVASFASFVDFYRPKYGILENVITIVGRSPEDGKDYFGQLLCAIVGMGYQTQIILGDAWTYGAPQSRSRTLLLFALPGYTLPARPMMSHSHPQEILGRGLGKMSNGEQFARRELGVPTAFRYVTSGEAMRGLPKIQDGRVRICPGFPDHRSNVVTPIEQLRTTLIPTAPYGMGFAKAYYESGQITEAERNCFPAESSRVKRKSRGWTRLNPTRLFYTVTTTPQPTDARTAGITHPSEHRTLSILEIRRAQGMPDDEVLVGSLANRWKLVGNSVARQAALALGLELRRAICGSLYETRDDAPTSVGVGVTKAAAVPAGVEEIETVVKTTTTTTMTTEIEVCSWPIVAHKPASVPDGPKQPSAQGPPPPPPQRPVAMDMDMDGDRGDGPTATVQLSAKTTVVKSSTVTSRYGGAATGVKRRQSCGNEVWEESMVKRHRRSSMEDAIVCR